MNKDSKLKNQFFSLVKSGLWGSKPDQNIFNENTDWNNLYELSKKQALLGIVLDGIELLPECKRPPRPLYLKWCADVLHIEDENIKLNKRIGEFIEILRSENIEPIVLKGQGVGSFYPNPMHRNSGDIDLYIGEKNFEKVNRILEKEGRQQHETNARHSCYSWREAIIENHKILAKMSPFTNGKLQKYIKQWHENKLYEKVNLNGFIISTPPLEFDVVYILLHIVKHLIRQGIGLRQVCDWVEILKYADNKIDKNKARKILKDLKLETAAKIFGSIAVRNLGLGKKYLLIDYGPKDIEIGEKILNKILDIGNFGIHNDKKKDAPLGYWAKKWHSLKIAANQNIESWKVVPYEIIWSPYQIIENLLKSQFNKKFKHQN